MKKNYPKYKKFFDNLAVDRETYEFFVGYDKELVTKDTFLVEGKFKVPKENYKFSKGSRDIDIKEDHGKMIKKLINLLNPQEKKNSFFIAKNLKS